MKSDEARFWSKVQRSEGCWIWQGRCYKADPKRRKFPYGEFGYLSEGRWKRVAAHRMAWQLANQKVIPAGLQVCHTCDNPPCVNPAHLFLGTASVNEQDKILKGRKENVSGSNNPNALLNVEQVEEIRRLAHGGLSFSEIGRTFKIHTGTTANICRGYLWGHVPLKYPAPPPRRRPSRNLTPTPVVQSDS